MSPLKKIIQYELYGEKNSFSDSHVSFDDKR